MRFRAHNTNQRILKRINTQFANVRPLLA